MWNQIFGATTTNAAAQGMFGQQQYANQYQGGLAQQQAFQNAQQAYNQYAQQRTARWMIAGEVCYSVKDFAKKLFPEDEAAQLMLVLRFGED